MWKESFLWPIISSARAQVKWNVSVIYFSCWCLCWQLTRCTVEVQMSWNLSRRIHYLNMKICFHYSWPPIFEKAKWLLVIYFSHNCVQSIISNFGRKTLYSISSSTIKIKGRKIIFCQQTLLVKLQSL